MRFPSIPSEQMKCSSGLFAHHWNLLGKIQSRLALGSVIHTLMWPALALGSCHDTYPGATRFLASPEIKGHPSKSSFWPVPCWTWPYFGLLSQGKSEPVCQHQVRLHLFCKSTPFSFLGLWLQVGFLYCLPLPIALLIPSVSLGWCCTTHCPVIVMH